MAKPSTYLACKFPVGFASAWQSIVTSIRRTTVSFASKSVTLKVAINSDPLTNFGPVAELSTRATVLLPSPLVEVSVASLIDAEIGVDNARPD